MLLERGANPNAQLKLSEVPQHPYDRYRDPLMV
jgi:hypothetical protein